MRNTTKLKYILQLYTVSFDMEDDGNIYLTIVHKRTGESHTFQDKAYSVLVGKAFGYMKKELKEPLE